MAAILHKILAEMIFWMAWIIIPLLVEIIPAIGGFFLLLFKKLKRRRRRRPQLLPEITLIIPVYNSQDTLRGCIQSVRDSSYPDGLIDLFLVNNGSADRSFDVFTACQKEFPDLSMRWMNAQQGKSKALNLALFNSSGKYILHIDSDGKLERDALKNMVARFEQNPGISCMTGVILTDTGMIEATRRPILRWIRRCEFYEYAQDFLAGRNFESELNSVYTLSGAFSAFRKSTILKTRMYSSETVGEDTQVTFQIRYHQHQGVYLCEDALFFVEPVESFSKLYAQRQRWQRGELEVSHMFLTKELSLARGIYSNFMVKLLLFDHTFAFPRMIWYFAIVFLLFVNYPLWLVAGSVVLIYLLYVFSAFLFFLNVCAYLKNYRDIRRYYLSKWYYVFALPVFNFILFWVRFAAIINSIRGTGRWRSLSLREEWNQFTGVVKKDWAFVNRALRRAKDAVNRE